MKLKMIIAVFVFLFLRVEAQQYGYWEIIDSMEVTRYYFSTSIFSNNKILATGGETSTVRINSAEIYNLDNNTWENTNPMLDNRSLHNLITLNNGEVIAIGGFEVKSSEIFNPASNSWRYTDSLETLKYFGDTATLLNDGRILVVGGYYFDQSTLQNIHFKKCEIFNPITETWRFTDSLTDGRSGHTATLLNDGRVLVTGGRGIGNHLNTCEIYDPVTDQWSSAGNLLQSRLRHSAVLLSDGRVLVSGGVTPDSTLGTRNCEIYNPGTDSWSWAGEMIMPRESHQSLLLLDSTVLITGGGFRPDVWEIYDPKTLSIIYFDTLPVIVYDPELEKFPDGRIISIGGSTFEGMTEEPSNLCLMYTPRVTSVNEERTLVADYSVSQNYPNPFNPKTKISYAIPHTENVTLIVYDILGNEIATLVNEEKPAGNYEVEFDGSKLASGIYIYRLTAGNPSTSLPAGRQGSGQSFTASKKLILIK